MSIYWSGASLRIFFNPNRPLGRRCEKLWVKVIRIGIKTKIRPIHIARIFALLNKWCYFTNTLYQSLLDVTKIIIFFFLPYFFREKMNNFSKNKLWQRFVTSVMDVSQYYSGFNFAFISELTCFESFGLRIVSIWLKDLFLRKGYLFCRCNNLTQIGY